jgi:hypothetical protein
VQEHAAYKTEGLFDDSMGRCWVQPVAVLVCCRQRLRQLIATLCCAVLLHVPVLTVASLPAPSPAPMCSIFRNVDSQQGVAVDLPATAPGHGKGSGGGGGGQPLPIAELRARAVLVDMEEGVVNSILKASSTCCSCHAVLAGPDRC